MFRPCDGQMPVEKLKDLLQQRLIALTKATLRGDLNVELEVQRLQCLQQRLQVGDSQAPKAVSMRRNLVARLV